MPDDVANAIAGDAPMGGASMDTSAGSSMTNANFASAPPGQPEAATGDLPGFSSAGIGGESSTLAKLGHAMVYAVPVLSAIQQHREAVAKHQADEFNRFVVHSAISEGMKNPDIWQDPQVQKSVAKMIPKQLAGHFIDTMASMSQAIVAHKNSYGDILESVGGDVPKANYLARRHGVTVPPHAQSLEMDILNKPTLAATTQTAKGQAETGVLTQREEALRPGRVKTSEAREAGKIGVQTSPEATDLKVAQAVKISRAKGEVTEQFGVRKEFRAMARKADEYGQKQIDEIRKEKRHRLSTKDVSVMEAHDADGKEIKLTPQVTTIDDLEGIIKNGGTISEPGFWDKLKNFTVGGGGGGQGGPPPASQSDVTVDSFTNKYLGGGGQAAPPPAPAP